MGWRKRNGIFVDVSKIALTRVPAPSSSDPPESNLQFWWEYDDVVLDGGGLIEVVNDKSGNALDLTFGSAQPFSASGGANNTGYWTPGVQATIAGYHQAPISANHTLYAVLNNTLGAPGRHLIDSNSPSSVHLGLNQNFGTRDTYIMIGGTIRSLVNANTGFGIVRFRWNASGNAVKTSGVTESTDATLMEVGRFFTQTQYNDCPISLILSYSEDTIASGADAAILSFVKAKYDLTL